MRERLGHDRSLGLSLERVVADRGGRPQALVHVAGLEDLLLLVGVVRPDAGVAVRLELRAHAVGVGVAAPRLSLQRPEEALDVVPDLVADHVGSREVARCLEPPLELAEEREVEVDRLITGTVERAHRGAPRPTRGRDAAVVERELGRRVSGPLPLEESGPDHLGAPEHTGHEVDLGLVLGRADLLRRRGRVHVLDEHARVASQEEVGDGKEHAHRHRGPPPRGRPSRGDRARCCCAAHSRVALVTSGGP